MIAFSVRRRSVGDSLRQAFTLIEVLTVMAVLSLVGGVLVVALGGALRLEKASAAALDRMGARRDLAEQFRADAARATDAPERWQEEAAGPTCLILAAGQDRHVVYRWDGEQLTRTETTGAGTRRRAVAVGGAADLEFGRQEAGGRLLALRLFSVGADGRKRASTEILAALGGDLQ